MSYGNGWNAIGELRNKALYMNHVEFGNAA
jgi:hypothetical protein